MEKRELLKRYEKAFKEWRGLKTYVLKRIKGNNSIRNIERNIDDMIEERNILIQSRDKRGCKIEMGCKK